MDKMLSCFLVILILNSLLSTVMADNNACPYPCYPSPTDGITTPATSTEQPGSYPPPQYYPPPGGNYPNYPPGGGGDYGGVAAPPPPDPILPYFPYYYRNGVHRPTDQISSTAGSDRSTATMILTGAAVIGALYSSLL